MICFLSRSLTYSQKEINRKRRVKKRRYYSFLFGGDRQRCHGKNLSRGECIFFSFSIILRQRSRAFSMVAFVAFSLSV